MALVNTPPQQVPKKLLTDPELSGYFKQQQYFLWQLYQRSGGGEDITEVSNDQIEVNTGDITNINADLSNLVLTYVAKSINYTASAGNFVSASNGITVTMPSSPSNNAAVTVFNSDGSKITIDGNGNNIDDTPTKTSVRKNTALNMIFYTVGSKWVIS